MTEQSALIEARSKHGPKRFFGLMRVDTAFLSKLPHTEFNYHTILDVCEFAEKISLDRSTKSRVATIRRSANKSIEKLKAAVDHVACPQQLEQMDRGIAGYLKTHLRDAWDILSFGMKVTRTAKIPKHLEVIYMAMESKNIGGRIHNRLDSNYLYDQSSEKELILIMIDVGIDGILNKYIDAMSVVKKTNPSKTAEITDSLIETFEYILIMFNKIDSGWSLYTFEKMQTETTEPLNEWFEAIQSQSKKTA